ncbi:MAG: mechanosensitive ion channel family protein [Oscillospiraceae bacterium]|nr:mechanosensitive ion channel family protein [Oscillospiraceae bacterium]
MNGLSKITNDNLIEPIQKIPGGNYIIFAIIMLVAIVLSPFISKLIVAVFGNRKKKIKENHIYKPIRFTIYVVGLYIALAFLGLPNDLYSTISKGLQILIIMLVGYCLAKIVAADSRIVHGVEATLHVDKRDTTGLFLTKVFKGLIFIATGIVILMAVGVNLSGFFTSLGLTGAVVALAAQDLFKNLFGGITIVIDKPFKVGDWIDMGGIAGTVEDITFRSTRLRTFNGTLAIIPNSVLSNENLVCNRGLNYRKYIFTLNFTYNTPLEKINNFIVKGYDLLESLPNVIENTVNINFDKITESGYQMYIHLNTNITVYADYMKFKELINLKIIELVEKEKIKLAYHTQTIIAESRS